MKMLSWNLNGLLSCIKHDSFHAIAGEEPDIICLQEIRTKQELEVLPGYRHYWNHSQRDGYSGTVTLTRDEPQRVVLGLGDEQLDAEGRVITVELSELYVVNCYAPNSQKNLIRHHYRMDWDDALRGFLCELAEDKPVVACGDFNVARADIDIYPENLRQYWAQQGYASDERSKLETLLEEGFTDAFRHLYPDRAGAYTWWSNRLKKRDENRGWRLDYFFLSDDILDTLKDVRHLVQVTGSDHCPIVLELAL